MPKTFDDVLAEARLPDATPPLLYMAAHAVLQLEQRQLALQAEVEACVQRQSNLIGLARGGTLAYGDIKALSDQVAGGPASSAPPAA